MKTLGMLDVITRNIIDVLFCDVGKPQRNGLLIMTLLTVHVYDARKCRSCLYQIFVSLLPKPELVSLLKDIAERKYQLDKNMICTRATNM